MQARALSRVAASRCLGPAGPAGGLGQHGARGRRLAQARLGQVGHGRAVHGVASPGTRLESRAAQRSAGSHQTTPPSELCPVVPLRATPCPSRPDGRQVSMTH